MITIANIRSELMHMQIYDGIYIDDIIEKKKNGYNIYHICLRNHEGATYNIFFYRELGQGGIPTKYLFGCPEAELGEYLSEDEVKAKGMVIYTFTKLIKSARG